MKRRIAVVATIPEENWEKYQELLFILTEQLSIGRFGLITGTRKNVGQLAINVLATEELLDRENGEIP